VKVQQKVIVGATLAAGVGTVVYLAWQALNWRDQVQALRQQQAPLSDQVRELQRERDDAQSRLASLVDNTERIKGNSNELLKLRGEVGRLRWEAKTAAAEMEELKKDHSVMEHFISNTPPVKTFVSTAAMTVDWNQGIATGGWKTPSGKRTVVLAMPERGASAQELTIKTYVLEYTEAAGKTLGLGAFNVDPTDSMDAQARKLDAEQARVLLDAAGKSEGVEITAAPTVTTTSGRQCSIEALDIKSWAGQQISLGPALNCVPTISPDGQSVQMVTTARFNCWSLPPL